MGGFGNVLKVRGKPLANLKHGFHNIGTDFEIERFKKNASIIQKRDEAPRLVAFINGGRPTDASDRR
ncbi:unnamed protein product [marine sediment metagenome]|uniref:Uncharacterized protein n=1 Tax=marine sediment metagenome TaxID=412755 RepID=X0RWZ2_9ZZZZ